LGNGPAGTPTCPSNSGTVTGTWTAASVQAIPTENVNAGDFDALTDALTSNTAYANIHTTAFAAGEIRGQVHLVEQAIDLLAPLEQRPALVGPYQSVSRNRPGVSPLA